MSYWRKLFVIVLLALSLPVQSLAAVSMNCEVAHVDDVAPARHPLQAGTESGHGVLDMTVTAADHRHPGQGDAHHAHPCATCVSCVSCCVGAGLPAGSVSAAFFDAVRITPPFPQDAGTVSFLTDGIERPPRTALV
ncbi:hypothetical protein WS70_19665 [Burkholderia mayonis]|uniref:DUF2946 domain-containing protein n=1 Tax=Burkholderia mayonis TaxID=1385591 RepID=A0A1B4FKA2_9BURK|nr:hypothetical protein [Burkholderia mayonis]AOJ04101.1 hypothetical protein WS70_19665 [Burkholderia mayonis]KVE46120.1 hypothetical protein WS70_02995 [Burkholderia mayonis]